MRLHFCGGAGEIGASCILLTIDGRNLVLDCGMRMGSGKDPQPDLHSLQEAGGVDAIVVSHAHMDHTGSLPILCRAFPRAKVYMTHATKDLVRVLLFDSLKLMEMREAEIPLYSEGNVRDTLERTVCFSPGFSFRPVEGDVVVKFYGAGHVAGAVAVHVTGRDGSLFYSGDFSCTPQRTVPGASVPHLKPDVAILESTYGDRLHSNRELQESRLVEQVKAVTAAGGKMLIPAFALGRAQEVILILKKAMNKGQLPKTKVYVDGMVRDICRVYQANPNYLHHLLGKRILKGQDIFFDDDNIVQVTGRQAQREAIMASSEPCCIISSSGMLSGGPSQWYAARLTGIENAYIALTGYQDEESPGRQLADLAAKPVEERTLKLGDQTLPVKCGTGTYSLSAHADRTEIGALATSLRPGRLFLVHGNPEASAALAKDIQLDFRGEVHVPLNGESYDIPTAAPRAHQLRRANAQPSLPTMSQTGVASVESLTLEGLSELHAFVLANVGSRRGCTLEELYNMWTGLPMMADATYIQMRQLVTESPYFTPELRRPFIYHAVESDALVTEALPGSNHLGPGGRMEVNAMLAELNSLFPPETGLYKRGARADEGIALLSFNYPAVAGRYADSLLKFAARTGWKPQLNTEVNLSAAQALITRLFREAMAVGGKAQDAAPIEKISYHGDQGCFRVKGHMSGLDVAAIALEFENATGLTLRIEGDPSPATCAAGPTVAARRGPALEQNATLAAIDAAFANRRDKPYRKSIKGNWIELSFISEAVGQRYQVLLDELASQLGWELRLNRTPNQNDLLSLAKAAFEEAGLGLKKGPSYRPSERCVAVTTCEADDARLSELRAAYEERTGVPLITACR